MDDLGKSNFSGSVGGRVSAVSREMGGGLVG